MAVAVPERIREKLGNEVTDDLVKLMAEVAEEKSATKDEVLAKWTGVNARLAGLETLYGTLHERIDKLNDTVNARIDRINERMERLEVRVNERMEHLEIKVNERIIALEAKVNEMERRLTERMERMEARLNERMDNIYQLMNAQLKWMVGTISFFGILITIVMTVFKFIG